MIMPTFLSFFCPLYFTENCISYTLTLSFSDSVQCIYFTVAAYNVVSEGSMVSVILNN